MKAYFLMIGVIISLVLVSCTHTSSPREGFLTVKNTTNGNASVSINGSNSVSLQPRSTQTFRINTGKSVTTHISYTGDYINSGSDNIEVSTDHTSTYDLYADCGRLLINNNSESDLYITFAGQSSIRLDPNSYDFYKIVLPDGISEDVSFSYKGLYVFPANKVINVYGDELTTFTVNADGGAIKITNNSSATIEHIYLSPATDNEWGPDALHGDLYNGDYSIWTAEPGYWDIKFIDIFGDTYYIYDERVNLNQILSITYTDSKSSTLSRLDKKQSGPGHFKRPVQFMLK